MCSVPSAYFAQWYEDHLRFIGLPIFLFVTGITLLYWMIPLQLFITLVRPPSSPAQCLQDVSAIRVLLHLRDLRLG
jgi:hypothetical protein